MHWGNGRATTGEVKGHGRHKYWLWPLFEKENIEAGCQQCHARDRVTQGAETLNLVAIFFGARLRRLSSLRSARSRNRCTLSGAAEYDNFEEQILANEKQIREEHRGC